ncbi:uncharacterized protein SAPINGB_P004409 [Magnusiomyces paraingens]|uniref:3-hydroxy-3-methylglutaryl coenzyme A reductase n=1 Tax=Magnusiomyces paraingens TaxID=2606893 RepID=A0A5E8BWK3_9ASCO|nr:uncharacterized protein SAPINGB_P004409 [Saprochaete ingens]VVT55064.1 unnamed protein product [Saprochaete ingens]
MSTASSFFKPFMSLVVYISVHAAKRPIHTIVSIAALATTAYFSILDLSVGPANLDSFAVSYYHPGGPTSNASEWVPVSSSADYPDAPHYASAKLVFAGLPSAQVPPVVPNTFDSDVNPHEKSLVVPYDELSQWLKNSAVLAGPDQEPWRLRQSFSWVLWAKWNFTRLLDLIHATETFDLAVVFIGYLAMYFTFISLYISMKHLGSKFWLATSVMLSSTFAFMFAFVTSFSLGVPVSLITLSEGLPFLVATVGFGNKIKLTRATLKAVRSRPPGSSIEHVVSDVLSTQGTLMLRDYSLEIIALLGGAYFGVNGLWQFCFLSAWILFYDYILTATFYSAILSIKVEIGKIKQKESIRQALEEDGVSESVAESVAETSTDTPGTKSNHSVTLFKIFMVSAFLFLNFVQLSPSVFQTFSKKSSSSETLFNLVPFADTGVVVTILPTLIFEHASLSARFDTVFHRILNRLTEIVADPLISKFIVIGLAISIGLNAYLFRAAQDPVVVKVVEKVVEVEKKVHVYLRKTDTPPSDRSSVGSSSSNDAGLELQLGKTIVEEDYEEVKLRSLQESEVFLKAGNAKLLNDEELVNLALAGKLPLYAYEKTLGDNARAVTIRRAVVSRLSETKKLESSKLPYLHFDYDRVFGACCENVIGYIPLPIGVAGPLVIDGKEYFIPMATTEGCLVASTMRGCKAINAGGGVTTVLTHDGMTRGPCVQFPSLRRAGEAKLWLDSEEGQRTIKKAFNSTSRFARLQTIKTAMAGTLLFIRFCTTTGDAMGMNMISKGVEYSLKYMAEQCGFEDMEEISVSGNYCSDKKPAAINWIEGRGKSIVAESLIPKAVVEKVLKSDVDALVELNISKNLVGSAMAGSIGGNNAQAANLVAAIYLATGQDPAQVVESANCMTLMKNVNGDLHLTVSMPSIEVGTIGGGTILEAQGSMLDLLGVRGPHPTDPGSNARQLAKIVASGVMAAELSLCSALAAGHLVQSHMALNRSKAPTPNPGASSADIKRLTEGSQICIKS